MFFSGLGRRWGLKNGRRLRGVTPRLSGDETRQAVEQHGEDRLIGGAGRQVDLDLGFQYGFAQTTRHIVLRPSSKEMSDFTAPVQ